jgi:hypothetical protein
LALAGGAIRFRNRVAGAAASPPLTRECRIDEVGEFRSALKAAAAGRTAAALAIAATTSAVVNAAIRGFFKVSLSLLVHQNAYTGELVSVVFGVTDLDVACKGSVQGSQRAVVTLPDLEGWTFSPCRRGRGDPHLSACAVGATGGRDQRVAMGRGPCSQ